jgi:enoyl-CoA hydratase/carnithine racemase
MIDRGTVRLPRIIGHGRSLDLILTGQAVAAEEALQIGLVNRVVEKGKAREAATEVAKSLAEFPQPGMRGDRLSVYHQWSLSWEDARNNELHRGMESMHSGEAHKGATRFASGSGRYGKIDDE